MEQIAAEIHSIAQDVGIQLMKIYGSKRHVQLNVSLLRSTPLISSLIKNDIYTVRYMDNLHVSKEFFGFPTQVDTDICADALELSTQFRAE